MNNIPCDAKRKKMRSSGQLFRACWPSSAEHTATSLSGITEFIKAKMSAALVVEIHPHKALLKRSA